MVRSIMYETRKVCRLLRPCYCFIIGFVCFVFLVVVFCVLFFFFWTEMGNGKVGFKNLAPRNKGIFSEFFLCFRNILALFVSNLEFMPPWFSVWGFVKWVFSVSRLFSGSFWVFKRQNKENNSFLLLFL